MKHAEDNGAPALCGVAAVAHAACRLQLTSSSRGVISERQAENGLIKITAADVGLEKIDGGSVLLVNRDGDIVDGTGAGSLPEELELHLKVYRDRSDVNALVHLYPPHACVYADRGELFAIPDQSARREIGEFIRVICRECPSRFTGLCSCWSDIRQSASGAGALLVKDDGIVTLAADIESALRKAELIEAAARQAAG